MKISKILAGMSAAALAASMMSLVAFADETTTVKADLTGGTISLIDEKDDDGVVTKTGVLTGTNVKLSDVCGIDVNVTVGADSAAKIEAGDFLAVDAEGLCQKATTGQYILAMALTPATAKGDIVNVAIIHAGYEA